MSAPRPLGPCGKKAVLCPGTGAAGTRPRPHGASARGLPWEVLSQASNTHSRSCVSDAPSARVESAALHHAAVSPFPFLSAPSPEPGAHGPLSCPQSQESGSSGRAPAAVPGLRGRKESENTSSVPLGAQLLGHCPKLRWPRRHNQPHAEATGLGRGVGCPGFSWGAVPGVQTPSSPCVLTRSSLCLHRPPS